MATAKKLPSGSYRIRIYVGKKSDGSPDYKSFTAPTKKEAELLAAQYNITHREKTSCTMTVSEAIQKYIENKTNVLSPTTIRGYIRLLKGSYESIGWRKICDLTDDMVQKFINEIARNHAPKTVRNVNALLISSITEAAPEVHIRVKLPKKKKGKTTIPTDAQIKELMKYLEKSPDMQLAIAIASVLGLRRGEICALTWADLDNHMLHVSKSMAYNEKNEWVIKAPKTAAGTRTIPVPTELEAHFLRLKPANAAPSDRIFQFNPNNLTQHFIIARKKLGYSFRLHDLRHYNASIMIYLGIPDIYAMRRMGHATPNMLKNVYQHIIEEKKSEQDDKLNAYMQEHIF